MQAEYLVTMANDITRFFESSHLDTVYAITAGEGASDRDGYYTDVAGAVEKVGDKRTLKPAAYQAASEAASHMRRFWDPRMRSQMIEIWRAGDAQLSTLAAAAVGILAEAAAQPK
jgi:NADH-dependant formate dehydrogenase delta subunit FdsD